MKPDEEQPVGQAGELVIRGGVMLGYWNMPEKTAQAIKDGWLHTGDMGVMDDEGLFHHIRALVGADHDGQQGDLSTLYGRGFIRHPAVHYAGVIGRKHETLGQVPVGIVELWEGQYATPEELLTHCRAILGAECTLTEVIIIPKMPMTPTGKIGKQDLIKEFGG